jgi:hypothetical protein
LILDLATTDLWGRAHNDVATLWARGAAEYVGARCCAMNGAYASLLLATEVVERYLEITIRLDKSKQARSERTDGNVETMLVEVIRRGITEISEFQPIVAKLREIVDGRRPATLGGAPFTREALTTYLEQIDELVFILLDRIDAPDEFKFSVAPYVTLFETSRDAVWLKMQNQAFESRRDRLQARYIEVYRHLRGQAPQELAGGILADPFATASRPPRSRRSRHHRKRPRRRTDPQLRARFPGPRPVGW